MALHKDFPDSRRAALEPKVRWFHADEALRGMTMDKLMPPLVAQLRRKVDTVSAGTFDENWRCYDVRHD